MYIISHFLVVMLINISEAFHLMCLTSSIILAYQYKNWYFFHTKFSKSIVHFTFILHFNGLAIFASSYHIGQQSSRGTELEGTDTAQGSWGSMVPKIGELRKILHTEWWEPGLLDSFHFPLAPGFYGFQVSLMTIRRWLDSSLERLFSPQKINWQWPVGLLLQWYMKELLNDPITFFF